MSERMLLPLGPVTSMRRPFFKGRMPLFSNNTWLSTAAARAASLNSSQATLSYAFTSQVGLSNRPRRYFRRSTLRQASSMRFCGIRPSFTAAIISSQAVGSYGSITISIPAFMPNARASLRFAATRSRVQRLLMSAQSVTIIPSQFRSSLSQTVSSSWLACIGTPLMDEELTIKVSAPASMQALKGAKCFSRRSDGDT